MVEVTKGIHSFVRTRDCIVYFLSNFVRSVMAWEPGEFPSDLPEAKIRTQVIFAVLDVKRQQRHSKI